MSHPQNVYALRETSIDIKEIVNGLKKSYLK